MKRSLLALAILAAPLGCANLTVYEDEGCGNLVINLDEDCDTETPYVDGTCAAPGETHACFFTCTYGAEEPGCPSQDFWMCGPDNRCRRPSGDFDLQLGAATSFVENFAIGDVDGDSVPDLIGSDGIDVSVLYGNGDGVFSDGFTKQIPPPTGALTFGRLDGDALLDMLVPISFGFFTLKGTDARTLEPYNYAPFGIPSTNGMPPDAIRVVAMQAMPVCEFQGATFPDPAVEHLIIVDQFMTFAEIRDPMVAEPTPPMQTAKDLAGSPATAFLDGDFVTDVAMTFKGAREVHFFTASGVYDPECADDPMMAGPLRPEPYVAVPGGPGDGNAVVLPPGYVAAAKGVEFLDMDNDDDLDLVIAATTDAGEEGELPGYVLWSPNLGDGTFEPVALPVPFFCDRYQGLYEEPEEQECAHYAPWPLATGDFDGDGWIDYVFNDQVVLSNFDLPPNTPVGPGPPPPLDEPAEEPFLEVGVTVGEVEWDEAVVLDLNGDGALDIAASSSEARGIDIFLNADNPILPGFFNPFRLHTDEPVRNLRVGDFDGDLLSDVAFLQGNPDIGRDRVAVIYGSVSGGPSQVVDMGEVGRVQSMDRTSVLISPGGFDLIDDLMYVATPYVRDDDMDGMGGMGGMSPLLGGNGEDDGGPPPALALMFGDSSRTMVSPFFLEIDDEDVYPVIGLPGQFGNLDDPPEENSDPQDAVLVYSRVPVGNTDPASFIALMVGVGNDGDLKFSPEQLGALPRLSEFHTGCARWVSGSVRANARDVIIGVDNGPDCGDEDEAAPANRILIAGGFEALIPAGNPRPFDPPLDISNPGDIDWYIVTLSGDLIGNAQHEVRRVQLANMDGDDDLDLVVVLGADEDSSGVVVVLWNEENCGANQVFCAEDATPVTELYEPGQMMPSDDVILDAAPMQSDDRAEPELMIITNEEVWIGRFEIDENSSTRTYTDWRSRSYGGGPVEEELDGALRTADINGDGLIDVVANTQDRLRVLLQREHETVGQTLDRDPEYLERFRREPDE